MAHLRPPRASSGSALVCAWLALLVAACGPGDVAPGSGDAASGGDAGALVDSAVRGDASVSLDAGPRLDGGPRPDSGPAVPEVCDNGVDDDGDMAADCADDECWAEPACAAADVASTMSGAGLSACLDPIERSAADSDADCGSVIVPPDSMYETQCGTELRLSAQVRFFCDGEARVRAAWILERLTLPSDTRMITMRRFQHTYHEHTDIIDYESYFAGAGGHSGSGPTPLHESWGRDATTLVTVRAVEPGASIERLLGVTRIESLIDLDLPMSMDSRSTFRVGATTVAVP